MGLTVGMVIDQGSNTDNAIQLRASGFVAHGITADADTDVYMELNTRSGTQGGVTFKGYTEGNEAIAITAVATTEDTTDTSSSVGAITLRSYVKSGTGKTNMGANANLLAVRNGTLTRFLIDADGDIHATNTSITALDEYDDVALLRTFDRETTIRGIVDSQWDKLITYNRKHLEAAGVLVGDFISVQGMQRLTSGAIWQLHERIAQLEAQLGNT
jgi:hypothetical protein